MKPRSVFTKIAMGVLLTAVLLSMLCVSVSAKNTTALTTTVPTHFQLSVEIEGNGAVVVNSEKFTQSAVIEVERNVPLEISVIADDRYEVKSVLYNEKDITKDFQNGVLHLSAMEQDGMLKITFVQQSVSSDSDNDSEKGDADITDPDTENSGSANTDTPTTGDQSRYVVIVISLAATASILAIIVLLAAIKKRRAL